MIKVKDGVKYLSIGDMSAEIGVTALTLKRWIKWGESKNIEMPERFKFGNSPTAYFREDAIEKFRQFRKDVKFGDMADFNKQFWGKRGQLYD